MGVDVSEEILDLARSNAAEEGVGNVTFEAADVYAFPFDDAVVSAAGGRRRPRKSGGVLSFSGRGCAGIRRAGAML